MDSIDDDDFLAGLAPPSIKATVGGPTNTQSDDASSKTPSMPNTPGGSAVGRKPVADATSTLLNFLKQEQALVSDIPRPANRQQEPHPQKASAVLQNDSKSPAISLASSPMGQEVMKFTSEQAAGAALLKTGIKNSLPPPSTSNNPPMSVPELAINTTSAAPSSLMKPVSSTAVTSTDHPAVVLAGISTPASVGVPAGRVSALRQQLEATATPNTVPAVSGRRAVSKASGQPAPAAAAVTATKLAVKHSDSWELDDEMLPDGSGSKHLAAGAAASKEEDASGSSYMPSFAGSSSRMNSGRSRITDHSGAVVVASDVSTQGTAGDGNAIQPKLPMQMAAAEPASGTKQPILSQEDTEKQQVASQMAAALARRAQLSQQQATSASNSSNHSMSPAVRTAGSRSVTPADAAAAQLSESPLSTTSGRSADMTAATAGFVAPTTSVLPLSGTLAANAAAAGISGPAPGLGTVLSGSGSVAAGGLLARGLADLGITDLPATTGPPWSHTNSSRVTAMAAVTEQQRTTSSSGLPPGVVPLSGKPGTAAPLPLRGPSSNVSSAETAATLLSALTSAGSTPKGIAADSQQEQPQQPVATQQPQQQQQQQVQQQASVQPLLPLPAAISPQPNPVPAGSFEFQLNNVRQLASLQQELADQRLTIARLQQQAEEEHARHQAEVSRLRSDLDAAHQKAAADAAAARNSIAQEIAAAEARAQRGALLERDIALAQLQAQTAAIAQEREALAAQRVNTDVLANLSEQVRDAAAATAERECRALAALEKSTAERAAAMASRERRLQDREEQVSNRERELDELKSQLGKVLAGLEDQATADKRVMEAQTARLARESARLEALQATLLIEREETKLAVTQEKQALEEARTARIKEREAFIAEMTAERRRLAEESAATARVAEEARANLLDLKGRVAEYEATAAAALRQAREEEARAAAAREKMKGEQEKLTAAQKEVQLAGRKVDEDRTQLQEWGARLAALTREFDAAKEEVKAARTEIQTQRITLATQVAAVMAAQEQLELQRDVILKARVDLDRQRVVIAEERAVLSRERIAASQAATGHRPQAAIVATNGHCITGSLDQSHIPRRPHTAPCNADDVAVVSAANNRQQKVGSTTSRRSLGVGRTVLRKLLEELQLDQQADQSRESSIRRSRGMSKTVVEQRHFLDQLKAATRQHTSLYDVSNTTFSSVSGAETQLFNTTGLFNAARDTVTGVNDLLASPRRRSGCITRDSGVAAAVVGSVVPGLLRTRAVSEGPAVGSTVDTHFMLQQLAQMQQGCVIQPVGAKDSKHSRQRSSSKRSSKHHKQSVTHGNLLLLQQLQATKTSQQEQKRRQGSSASRVSSDLTQLIALSVSDSSNVESVEKSSCLDDLKDMQQLTDSSHS